MGERIRESKKRDIEERVRVRSEQGLLVRESGDRTVIKEKMRRDRRKSY